jgi:parallel beta-helix repeat protein
VYCKSGYRSGIASDTLDSHNFTKVYNMLGGILAWQSAYYPVWIATVHNVNTTLNYDTIQAAIDAPQTLDGHTILVDAGTYYEHVVVDKSISLNGENRDTTVIDGNGTGNVINVTSHHVSVTGFTIQNGTNGILINTSNYNTISGNNLKNNSIGIHIVISPDNAIYHNNFINNTQQVYSDNSTNVWDNGYPSGGNYWSDYNGTDLYSGPYQNETGCECKPACDGIGDTPYVINGNNQDNYPLMHPRIIGDVNLDGTVNVMDMLALKIAITLGKTVEECPSCDVNCNGVVNIMDMLRLKIIITLA